MMEYWDLKAEFILILIPVFPSSNIPLFHVIVLRHDQSSLTWIE